MVEKNEPKAENPPLCPFCNGSGQTSSFGGESRFMFTWEDCPDCCGTGIQLGEVYSTNGKSENPPTKQ